MTVDRSREERVALGQSLVRVLTETKWELGDLAIEEAGPARPHAGNDGSVVKLERFALDIGIATGTLRRYRAVASAWPPDKRSSAAWSIHRTLMSLDERFDLIDPGMRQAQAAEIAHRARDGAFMAVKISPSDHFTLRVEASRLLLGARSLAKHAAQASNIDEPTYEALLDFLGALDQAMDDVRLALKDHQPARV